MVKLKDNMIQTDLYYKVTDSHQYLHFNSCHPRHTKISIPYAQARRLCTIIDDKDVLDVRLEEMKRFFTDRGYPLKLIEDGIQKAKLIPQIELRKVKEKKNEDIIPFVFTHNPSNPNVSSLIRSTFDLMQIDRKMQKTLKNVKYIGSKRQPPNLKRLLTQAKFQPLQTEEGGSFKCKDKRCKTCPLIHEGNIIFIKSIQKEFQIKSRMNCKSKNVLYIITCNGCREQYIGKTHDMLSSRMRVHRQQIRCPEYRKIAVSGHIDGCCNMDPKFTVTPFYKTTDDKARATVKEQHFIKVLKPTLNKLRL